MPTRRPDLWGGTQRVREAMYGAYVWGMFGFTVGFLGIAIRALLAEHKLALVLGGLIVGSILGLLGALAGAISGSEILGSRKSRVKILGADAVRVACEACPATDPAVWKLIVLGDLHEAWNADDEFYYSQPGIADLILWTGDLADGVSAQPGIAASLARLPAPAYGILGNHDGAPRMLASAEARKSALLVGWLSPFHATRVRELKAILSEREIGMQRREIADLGLTILGARPLSSGGPSNSFAKTLKSVYGIADPLAELQQQLKAAQATRVIYLGHNGPAGLGTEQDAPFGADYRADGGDVGDADYREILLTAQAAGKKILLAIGGHMHNQLHPRSAQRTRRPVGLLNGIPVLNACQVPRIHAEAGTIWHAHWEVLVSRQTGEVEIHRVSWAPGTAERRDELVFPLSEESKN